MDKALDLSSSFGGAYKGRRVLLTGHTGFKGSWLAAWLELLGAKVLGYSLPPPTCPSHFEMLKLGVESVEGDILDAAKLERAFASFKPEIVFHLAAQPLVRLSYKEPASTFAVNVQGTVNVLEAARKCPSVKAVAVVTSDKCYENREWVWGYRESDPMGGYDPYSASKGCAELVASSYGRSFFGTKDGALLASCRAGNVIGGGDWAEDRLMPDIMKAAAAGRAVEIRNPLSTRPWQHVLDPLSGYLLVGWRLLEGNAMAAGAWNFGPDADGSATVGEIAAGVGEVWPKAQFAIAELKDAPHEAGLLKLDCAKARDLLKWRPVWDLKTALERTVSWYRGNFEGKPLASHADIKAYCAAASRKGLAWTK